MLVREISIKIVRIIFATFLAIGMITSVYVAKNRVAAEHSALNAWEVTNVRPPEGRPRISQDSIDIALAIYGIKVPKTATHPMLEKSLKERGLSTREPWSKKINVQVGPSAFDSWALLGSTLAHELEVHCRQNFFVISLLDKFGMDGTATAERQAYLHEIKNAKRFGLASIDIELIENTMDYYYSTSPQGLMPKRFNKNLDLWVATNLIYDNSL